MGYEPIPHATVQTFSPRTSISSTRSDDTDLSLILSSKELLGPPSSPRLPTLRDYCERRRSNLLRRIVHVVLWVVVTGSLAWAAAALLLYGRQSATQGQIGFLQQINSTDTIVFDNKLPVEPMPIVKERNGTYNWTISIPPSSSFPLNPTAYQNLCAASHRLAGHLEDMTHPDRRTGGHHNYYHQDERYMQVEEAEKQKFLPGGPPAKFESYIAGEDRLGNQNHTSGKDPETGVCEKSMTFVLESRDAGFGYILEELWLAYGLAQKEGRAFFIDDRNWAYGKYSTYFKAPPAAPCLPPPEHWRVPCPHQADHLLISAAATGYNFGHAFADYYEDPRGMEVMRQKFMFGFMRAGYEALFHLANDDADYLVQRLKTLLPGSPRVPRVGVHVRHGDTHPWEFEYSKSFIPLQRYVDKAENITLRTSASAPASATEGSAQPQKLNIVVASDDPEVYKAGEFSDASRAQDRIVLESQAKPEATKDCNKVTTESMGWAGGFTTKAFWELGKSFSSAKNDQRPDEEKRSHPGKGTLQLRALVGRSYLLDLAVLGKSDHVVCTTSAIGCRLLAVIMGWDDAIVKGKWHNIDGDFFWKGIRW